MSPLRPIPALIALLLIAACGPDSPPPGPAAAVVGDGGAPVPVAVSDLDDAEVARLIFEAAADGDLERVPAVLPGRVSRVRVAVLVLHDQLLERREGTPPLAAILAALRRLAEAEGGADVDALGPLVAAWSEWTNAEAEVEAEMARHLTVGVTALLLPEAPGALGLSDLAKKADEAGSPPPMSPAAAGVLFLHYAALALGEGGSDVSLGQKQALDAASDAFFALGWPGGLAMLAEPVAGHLLMRDPNGVRASILWSGAADGFRLSGDPLRSGEMYIDRARTVWRGEADPKAAARAALLAETGRGRIEESGQAGMELFTACLVETRALQAIGRHADAVASADAAIAQSDAADLRPDEIGGVGLLRAVSLFHLGRFDDCLAGCLGALTRLGLDFTPELEDGIALPTVIRETAAQAALKLERFEEAIALFDAVIAFYVREDGNPWASSDLLYSARLQRARGLALAGDAQGARAAIDEVTASAPANAGQLALIADTLLLAGLVNDAADVVTQGEAAVGPERAAGFGELRGRIEAQREDMEAARVAFQAALTYYTGGDTTQKSVRGARVLESWARAEEEVGNRERAGELFHQAANHYVDIGMQLELERLLDEVRRLRH